MQHKKHYKSNELRVKEYSPTEKKLSQLKVYPNPADDFISIEIPYFDSEYLDIIIYNELGKEVYNKGGFLTGSIQSINISNLTTGIYIVKVGKGKDWKSVKFIRK